MDKTLFEKEMDKDPRLAKGYMRQRFKLDEKKVRQLVEKTLPLKELTEDQKAAYDSGYYRALLDACLSYKALLEKVNLL